MVNGLFSVGKMFGKIAGDAFNYFIGRGVKVTVSFIGIIPQSFNVAY